MTSTIKHLKSLLFVGFPVLFLSLSLLAQDWSRQHPNVDLNQLQDIYISQDNHGWVVGQKTILKTNDGGTTWEKLETLPNPYYTFEVVEYVEGSNGQRFYVGAYNALFETTDGGTTWTNVDFGGTQAKAIHIVAGHTVIYTENALFHSSNDGVNWSSVLDPTGQIVSMNFGSDTFGAASTEDGEIYYTNDGGATWVLSASTPGVDFPIIAFANTQVGYANVKKDVFKTTDGGQTWALISDETVHRFYFFEAMNETELYATRGSAIYQSLDGGVTWTKSIPLHYAQYSNGIHLSPDGNAWIAAGYGSIFHFDGNEWEDLIPANKNWLQNIVFFNDLVGLAVGGDRTILKTTDGGQNWIDLSDKKEDFQSFYDVYFFSENHFMVAGDSGIRKTTDGGQSWTEQTFSVNTTLFDFHSPDGSNKIYLSGNAGAIFVSADNGDTWSDIGTSQNDRYANISFPTEQIGYAATSYGGMMKTIDGGNTWNAIFLSSTQGFESLCFLSATDGFALEQGYQDFIKKTTDGGETWSNITLPQKSYWRKIKFIDDQTGWVVGGTSTKGSCYQTTNGGNTWELLYQSPFNLENMTVVNDGTENKIWVCGAAGVIARNGTIVSTHSTQEQQEPISLYPNPLAHVPLFIQGLDTHSSQLDIRVYDLAGKIHFSKNNHSIQNPILLDNLESGMYWMQMIEGNSGMQYVRKLLIINNN